MWSSFIATKYCNYLVYSCFQVQKEILKILYLHYIFSLNYIFLRYRCRKVILVSLVAVFVACVNGKCFYLILVVISCIVLFDQLCFWYHYLTDIFYFSGPNTYMFKCILFRRQVGTVIYVFHFSWAVYLWCTLQLYRWIECSANITTATAFYKFWTCNMTTLLLLYITV